MAMKPVYCLGVAGGPTVEISQEELRALLTQIEAELQRSKVYRSALSSLQTLLGGSEAGAKILIKAVGREAIRLVFQQLARQHKEVPPALVPETNTTVQPDDSTPASQPEDLIEVVPADNNLESALNVVLPTTSTSVNTTLEPITVQTTTSIFTKPLKKLTKAELAAQVVAQKREDCLQDLGQELRQARYSKSLSLRQMHEQTFVPLHLIEALETGRLDLLPEDVYVRGFIHRLGDALGLNGIAMAASLPSPDPVKTVVPSWYRPQSVPELHLSPLHLYVGYTALIAGAVGGLGLLSQQSTSGILINSDSVKPSPTGVSQSDHRAELTAKPGLKSNKSGVAIGSGISAPEAIGYSSNNY